MIEAVEPNYVKFILIEVGTRLLALRLEKAQELAQKVIDRRKPGDPSPEGYIGNVYTRPELCLLFLRLFYKCDAFYECRNHEEALALLKAGNEVCDEYWCDIFPNAQHIRALERLLPELIGAEEDLIQARQIRRNRVIDICILADSMRTDISPYLQELAGGVLKMFLCTKSSSFWLRLKPAVSTRQIYEYNLSIFINRKECLRDTSDEVRQLKELANKAAGSDPCSTQQKYTKKDVFATVMSIYRYLNEIATVTASVQKFSILSR